MLVCKRVLVVGIVASLAFVGVQAQASEFEISLGLEASQNSNPENLSDDDLIESELEQAGVLGLRGEIAGPHAQWSSDLNYEVRRFSEHEEADYELALGEADLTLGNERSRLLGEFSYTAEEELIDLRRGSTPDNLDFRAVSSGRLFLRSRNPQNRVSIFVNAANVEYEVSQLLESSQVGGGAIYQRAPSQTSLVSVETSGYSLDYKRNDEASYDYYLVTAAWRQMLRRMQYQVTIGANSIEKEEKSTSPYYRLGLEWREPSYSYRASFQQFLTDTSKGAGRTDSGDVVDPGNGRLTIVDQYRFQEAELFYRNSSICHRCDLTARAVWQREDYQTFKEENNTQRQFGVDFGYQPRRRLALSLSMRQASLQGDSATSRDDYTEQALRLSAVRSQLAKRGRLELFAQALSRDFDEGEGYDQDLVGLRFDWLLYER